ncbi:hypothetical protein, partial [Endozoicomonas sp. ONNA2]|uniref:hypothetical protein n=1 Tax=Endozoicomonas sp. ONNA2 TaxID=2828741 RepID=UPI002147755E
MAATTSLLVSKKADNQGTKRDNACHTKSNSTNELLICKRRYLAAPKTTSHPLLIKLIQTTA